MYLVADPGFDGLNRPPIPGAGGGGTNRNFCRKLHENGKNWTERGHEGCPLDPPLVLAILIFKIK